MALPSVFNQKIKIMKKSILFLLTAALLAGGALPARSFTKDISDDIFNTNVETLAEEEIIVGPLCMQCPDRTCSSLGEVFLDTVLKSKLF